MTDEQMASVAKALGHPARIRIARLLATQTECRGREIFSELPLAQSTVSQHLQIMKDAGLVQATPVGTATTYCLVAGVIDAFRDAIDELAASVVGCDSTPEGR